MCDTIVANILRYEIYPRQPQKQTARLLSTVKPVSTIGGDEPST